MQLSYSETGLRVCHLRSIVLVRGRWSGPIMRIPSATTSKVAVLSNKEVFISMAKYIYLASFDLINTSRVIVNCWLVALSVNEIT